MVLHFTRVVSGIYTATIGQRELVAHHTVRYGWQLGIRDTGTKGFGTDLHVSRPTLPEIEMAADDLVKTLATVS